MDAIPLFRAAHLHPYLTLLDTIGSPVDQQLAKARLPSAIRENPEAQLPLIQTLDFLSELSISQGIDNIALRARENFKISELSPEFINMIMLAPSLKVALENFFILARIEDSQLCIWVEERGRNLRICSNEQVKLDLFGTRHCEMNTNAMLVAIVQAFAGPCWLPDELAFHSSLKLGSYVQEHFPNAKLLVGQPMAWITIPQDFLTYSPHQRTLDAVRDLSDVNQLESHHSSISNLSESLTIALKPYLADGLPPIGLAADLAGVSVRTLQRRLAQSQTSYSSIVQCAQYELASSLLAGTSARILDVCFATGYDDQSNFTRAFRRISGVTPKQFRSTALAS